MSNFLKKNEKKLTRIVALSLAVIFVAMVAWIAIDKFLSISPYFEDQTFAAALADSLGKPARFLNEDDLEEFEVMVVSCSVTADPNSGYQTVTIPFVTLGKADYADHIIENTRKMNEETEEEEKEESSETSDTSDVSKDEGPKFDTVQVYATPSTVADIVKFKNLRVLSAIDSSTAYNISYDTYLASMYAQLTGSTTTVSASMIYKAIVPSDLDSLTDLAPLTKLEYLGVAYSSIPDLKGIENFPNLLVLDASTCKVTSVEGVEKAPELLGLYLGSNTLTKVDGVEKLEKLETLELSSNKIAELPKFSENSALINLSLSGNKLTKLDVNFKNLTSLYVDGNEIKDLAITAPKLETLNLSGNKLTKLDALKDLTTLEALDLSGNSTIIDLAPIASLKNLTTLGLIFTKDKAATKLTDISALKDMTKLETLSISYTGVKDIDAIAGLKELTSLTINNSKVVSTKALEKLSKLTTVDLSANDIEDVVGLKNKKKLSSLNLSENNIKDISDLKGAFTVDTIKTLNFKGNMITDWKPLDAYKKATITKENNSANKPNKDETSKDETSKNETSNNEESKEVSEEVSETSK